MVCYIACDVLSVSHSVEISMAMWVNGYYCFINIMIFVITDDLISSKVLIVTHIHDENYINFCPCMI